MSENATHDRKPQAQLREARGIQCTSSSTHYGCSLYTPLSSVTRASGVARPTRDDAGAAKDLHAKVPNYVYEYNIRIPFLSVHY